MPIISNFQRESFKVSDIPDGSESVKGLVQLSSDLNSTSTTLAATPKAMKNAYDKVTSIESSIPKSKITVNGFNGTNFTISNNDKIISGSIDSSGNTTIEINELGVYNVVGNYNGNSITTIVNINKIGSYDVDLYVSISFSTDSYSMISKMSKSGQASSIYSIGDTKKVVLNGNIGDAIAFNDTTVYIQILAFDHNIDVEMNGEHHMVCGFGKMTSSGTDTCFVDNNYGNTIDNSSNKTHLVMNTSNTSVGGWLMSYMRIVICPAFQMTLPDDLKTVLRSRILYTDNDGSYSNNNPDDVTTTTDTVYIPSEFEVHGNRTNANSYEQNYQKQLAYYANGNSKIRYQHNSTGTSVNWWLRSPFYNYDFGFCYVNTNAGSSYGTADYSYGFFPLITI